MPLNGITVFAQHSDRRSWDRGRDYFSHIVSEKAHAVGDQGCRVKAFHLDHVLRGHIPTGFNRKTPVVGSTYAVGVLFGHLFRDLHFPNIDVPEALMPHSRRWHLDSTVGELREEYHRCRRGGNPRWKKVFVKPFFAKEFDGFVFGPKRYDEDGAGFPDVWNALPDSHPIRLQEYREEVSRKWQERRFFVLDGVPLTHGGDVSGDSVYNPRHKMFRAVREMAKVWCDSPRAYAIDVAQATAKGKKDPLGVDWVGVQEVNSVLTCATKSFVLARKDQAAVIHAAWESYVKYGQTGKFR